MTNTLEEYASPRPMPSKYIKLGASYPHELRHQWLWQKSQDKETRTKLLKEYLTYGVLGVSVTAWKCGSGVCVDDGQRNTHWTMLYGYNDKGWKIYDSYAPHRKILSYDHNIEVCKRYILVPSSRQQRISILQRLIELFKQLLANNEESINPPVITPPKPELPPLQALRWETPAEARHSVRVLCDEMGLSVPDKNILCAVIACESGFNTQAINKNNDARKSTDYGICQYNSYWYIGEGKPIASVDEALNNPEKCVRVMINQYKKGQIKDWVCYSSGKFAKHL